MKWEEISAIHTRAVDDLVATATSVESARWLTPRAEGKWSPAEVVEHLNLAYDVMLREMSGQGGMEIRTKWWQRVLLRFTIVPKILRGDGFPTGARAPKETRPSLTTTDQRMAIEAFRDRAKRFTVAIEDARQRGQRLTHAYFGKASTKPTLLLVARHIEHHAKQLKACGGKATALDLESNAAALPPHS